MSGMKKDTLLFYVSDEGCDASASVVPTLSALAEKVGVDFETYICTRPESWSGKVLPFVGHNHAESFYYLANFYKKIVFCSISSFKSTQFKREVMAFGGDIVSCKRNDEVLEFYEDVFKYFGVKLPQHAMVIPKKPTDGKKWIAPYCYPDIQNSGKLGIDETTFKNSAEKLKQIGINKIDELYCHVENEGFEINCIDSINDGDRYCDITMRILERNLSFAKGVGFADASCALRWQAAYCRKKAITVYEDYDWEDFIPIVCEYAKKLKNNTVMGNQVVYHHGLKTIKGVDDVVTVFAQNNVIMDLVGHNPRIGFSIQTENKLPIDWMKDAPSPWESEYSDEYLNKKIDEGAIPVCFIFYAADLGHLPVLPRFLDMMSLDGMRAGLAFPSTWYDYQPEILEQLYVPLEQGGVFPQLEPMLSSVGVAVASEAEGFIAPDFYLELLNKAKRDIAAHIGERLVPKGYYPFQDSTPFYKADNGKPQYEVVDKAGFEYYITYKNGGDPASVIYETDSLMVINQQIRQWFPGAGNPLNVLKEWEQAYTKMQRPGWITLAFDTPFFALAPTYLGEIEDERMRTGWAKSGGVPYIYEAMQYVRRTGGETGKLFLLKPHELYRYAKLLKEKGLVKMGNE